MPASAADVDHTDLVTRTLGTCCAVVGLCLTLHLALSSRNDLSLFSDGEGRWFFTAALRDTTVLGALLQVLVADLAACSLALVALRRRDGFLELVAVTAVTAYLWFVVITVVVGILVGPPSLDAFRREPLAKVVALIPLVVVKERLFRRLHEAYARSQRLLFEVLAWNCRKDGLFNGFFVVATVAGVVGLSPLRVHWLLFFAKLWLLGGAALTITTVLRPSLGRADAMRNENPS